MDKIHRSKRKLISTFVCQQGVWGCPIQFLKRTVILASCVTVLVFYFRDSRRDGVVGWVGHSCPPQGELSELWVEVWRVCKISCLLFFSVNTENVKLDQVFVAGGDSWK